MNLGLYRSWHAIGAVVLVALFVAWHYAGSHDFGSRDDGNVLYLLTSGWIAVACYLALTLYAVRRAAHRLRLSPEFGWKANLPALEQAQSQLTELQNRMTRREVVGKPAVRAAAADILRRSGVQRVLRVELEPDPYALGLLRLRAVPREPLGRLASWLHAHLYYGVAVALIVWFHGGLRTTSTMGLLLNALSYVVIGSGLIGAFLWTFGPTWLTRAEREISIEKAHALVDHFDRKIAECSAHPHAARLGRELQTLQGQRQRVLRERQRLDFFRGLLRVWRLLHVPCSILLLALVCVHVLSIWYY